MSGNGYSNLREMGTVDPVNRSYLRRHLDSVVPDLLAELPAIAIVGPRAVGKTTTAARLARSIVHLDRDTEAAAFHADPDAALAKLPEPILLDEWQVVPGVLGAVKRAVDADSHPGRYLITGSVRADLQAETWPGTGRLVRLSMLGLSLSEIAGKTGQSPFLDRIAKGGLSAVSKPRETPNLVEYVELALRSGFPDPALKLSTNGRRQWLDSYLEQLLTRDTEQLAGSRDPDRLRRYFQAQALNTAGVVEHKTIYEAAGVNRKTADVYEQLLRNLLMIEPIPAWSTNRLKRLTRTAKRYVIDPAIAAALLNVDAATIMRDGDLLGRMIDTFVTAQFRSEISACETRPRLYHLRQEQGRHEVDLIVEFSAFSVMGIEIKADAAPGPSAARHLAWLRDELGDRFVGGIVLHTGAEVYSLGEKIIAAPISAIWSY